MNLSPRMLQLVKDRPGALSDKRRTMDAEEMVPPRRPSAKPTPTLGEQHFRFWKGKLREPSFVYVLQGDPGTPVKVGITRDVPARVAALQTGYPYKLRALYVMPGPRELEWQFHQKLKGHRLEGEWFGARGAERMFPEFERLSLALVKAYAWDGNTPTYRQPGFSWHRVRRQPVTVRWVEAA